MTDDCAIYEDTIALLETEGWVQGSFATDYGYCLVGALSEAAYRANKPAYSSTALLNIVRDRSNGMHTGLMSWNDAPGRTKEEVIEVLREACA